MHAKKKIDSELEFIDVYKKHMHEHPALREFECQKTQILNNLVPPKKEDNIVGFIYSPLEYFCGFSESDFGGYFLNMIDFEKKYDMLSAEEKRKIDTIKRFWEGITTKDKLNDSYDETEKLIDKAGIGSAATRVGGAIPNWGRLLDEGISGYRRRINFKLLGDRDEDTTNFYQALIKTCDLIEQVAIHYAKEVALFADLEPNPKEKERLLKVASICKKVPSKPAESFHEALQAIWTIMITGRFYNLGRFDQYMYPYFEKDISGGSLTIEDAYALLKEFWTKIHNLGAGLYEYEKGKYTPQLAQIGKIVLGGILQADKSGVNELTKLCLEVTNELKYENPSILLRWHKEIPRELIDLCLRMLRDGASNPAFFNDDVAIRMLLDINIPIQDAYNYVLCDCGDMSIGGKSYAGPDGSLMALKCLELALHNGKLLNDDVQYGFRTGEIENFISFEDLLNAYFRQVESVYPHIVAMVDKSDYVRGSDCVFLFRSLLVDDCIEKGKSLFRGGARYNWLINELHSMTSLYDSLAAIRKLVYEQKILTLTELVGILDNNYESAEDTRLYLLNRAPKFGNDDQYVDEIAQKIIDHLVSQSSKYQIKWRNGTTVVEIISTTVHISERNMGASADGRKIGMPLASSIGPTAGCDKNGPTAVLKSVSKITGNILNGSSVLNMSFDVSFFKTNEQRDKIASLLETYFELGGSQVQMIINSRETLLDAQKNPGKYSNLLVRVGGFSARFVELSKETQDEIINRTFH